MPDFAHIDDPRRRLLARLNHMLRGRPVTEYAEAVPGGVLMEDVLRGGGWSDLDRDVIAKYVLWSIEEEFGIDLTQAIVAAQNQKGAVMTRGTRSVESMHAYARNAGSGELRAVLAEAEREGDFELVPILRAEIERRTEST